MRNFLSLQPDYSKFMLATDVEKEQSVKMRPSASFWKDGFKRLFKNPVAIVCISIIVIFLLLAIFIPMFWPYTYNEMLYTNTYGQTQEYKDWIEAGNTNDFAYLKPFELSNYEKFLQSQGKSKVIWQNLS